jgi:hypothetical protein
MSGKPVPTRVQISSREEGYRAELVEVTISSEAAEWIRREAEHQLNFMLDSSGAAPLDRLGKAVQEALERPADHHSQAIVSELRNALRHIRPQEWFRRTDLDSSGRHIMRRVRVYRERYLVELVEVTLSQDAMRYLSKLADEQLRVIESGASFVQLDLLAETLGLLLRRESRSRERVWAREILDALKDIPHEEWFTLKRRERPEYD